ncbi:hypothetical protein Trydic_g10189 [Trypoxylus dichotomus]
MEKKCPMTVYTMIENVCSHPLIFSEVISKRSLPTINKAEIDNYPFLLVYKASVYKTTGQSPANVLFDRERFPYDLKFKPNEEVVGENYVSNLRKRMDEIHSRVGANIQETNDRMKEYYGVRAEDEYQLGSSV